MVTNLENLTVDEVSLLVGKSRPANQHSTIILAKADAPTQSADGKDFPASDFAYVPDRTKPSTWKLRLTATPGGVPDAAIVGAATAALGAGFRGQKVDIPSADRPAVVARVRSAWLKANPEKTRDDLPPVLKSDHGIMAPDERAGLAARLLKYLGFGEDVAPSLFTKEDDDMALSAEVEKQIKDMGEKIAKLEADKAAADARAAIAKADTAEALDVVIKGLTEAVAKVVAVDVEARKADLAKVKDGEAVKKFAEKLSDPLKVAFSKLNTKEQAEFMTSYKADGDPVAKALEEVTKQNATLAKQVADLGADAELRKTEDELKDLAGGPVNVAELAKTLVALRKHDKAAADAMLTQIRATAKQAQAGNVFRVIGKDGDGAGDAMGEIDKKAEAYAKEHKVTKAVATGAVLKIEPELYDRYLAEKREA